jgi:hypothetical protein
MNAMLNSPGCMLQIAAALFPLVAFAVAALLVRRHSRPHLSAQRCS